MKYNYVVTDIIPNSGNLKAIHKIALNGKCAIEGDLLVGKSAWLVIEQDEDYFRSAWTTPIKEISVMDDTITFKTKNSTYVLTKIKEGVNE